MLSGIVKPYYGLGASLKVLLPIEKNTNIKNFDLLLDK